MNETLTASTTVRHLKRGSLSFTEVRRLRSLLFRSRLDGRVVSTQTVTVLFTDLVGSTELASRLGPERTEALRQTHFGLLRGAVASAGGTEVKNLGDGLMVAFTSLSRALACAVGMQQAIERHNQRDEGAALSVRIGISTGEATEEDGDYFGDPVVEAARLCAAADGGQILATEVVRLMAGRHATQEFVVVGDLELKGIPEPVPTVEVAWSPAVADGDEGGQIPLPARLVGASAESLFAFFGRADELTRLGEIQKATAAEHRLRVTLISGEPGIGKTTLVAQVARTAHGAGANVVYGGCEEGLGVPYQPWITALSQLIEHAEEAVLRELVDRRGPAVARLLPDLAQRLSIPVPGTGSDADAERFLILEGAARLLAAVTSSTPVMVVLDDLHWVDAASLQLLRHLVTSAIPMSVHIVGTYRESDLSRAHPLVGVLADLRREPCVERIDLVGLDDVEILDLLGAAAGHEMADDGVALAHALRRETAGNPFFLVEVIRHLAETGAFAQDDAGRWVLAGDLDDLGLPSSVREVVAHRVARLGEPTQQVLTVAAVIGREFDLDLLAGLLDGDEDETFDLLESAIGAGLVSEPEHQFGRYRFVHAVIQHTLYQDLSASRRQRTHRRIAEALESRAAGANQPVEELARHWLAATRPTDAAKALLYARRAGDAALAAYAPLDAVKWYTQALDLHTHQAVDDDRARGELLIGLGTARRLAGLPDHRELLRDAGHIALRLADTDLLVDVALSRDASIDVMAQVDPDRLAVLEAALEAIGPDDSTVRARLLACLANELDPRDVDHRWRTAIDALDVAHRVGDEATFIAVLNVAISASDTPDLLDRRLRETKVALEIAERIGAISLLPELLCHRAQAVIVTGDIDEFDANLTELEAIADRTGLPHHQFLLHMLRSWRHLLAGRTAEADADADAALELGTRMGHTAAMTIYGSHVLQRTMQQGGLDGIVDLVTEALAENPTIPAWRTAVMQVYNELGRPDAAALFEVGRASDFDDLPFDTTWVQGVSLYAECAVDLGRADVAALLYERLLPHASRFIFVGSVDWGAAARPLGRLATLLGRYDEAEEHLRAALAIHERMQAPYWIARTHIDLAELCLARRGSDDLDTARALIEEAQRRVDQYGYAGLQPRIDRLTDRS